MSHKFRSCCSEAAQQRVPDQLGEFQLKFFSHFSLIFLSDWPKRCRSKPISHPVFVSDKNPPWPPLIGGWIQPPSLHKRVILVEPNCLEVRVGLGKVLPIGVRASQLKMDAPATDAHTRRDLEQLQAYLANRGTGPTGCLGVARLAAWRVSGGQNSKTTNATSWKL